MQVFEKVVGKEQFKQHLAEVRKKWSRKESFLFRSLCAQQIHSNVSNADQVCFREKEEGICDYG